MSGITGRAAGKDTLSVELSGLLLVESVRSTPYGAVSCGFDLLEIIPSLIPTLFSKLGGDAGIERRTCMRPGLNQPPLSVPRAKQDHYFYRVPLIPRIGIPTRRIRGLHTYLYGVLYIHRVAS